MIEKKGVCCLTVVEPEFGTVYNEYIVVGFFADSGRDDEKKKNGKGKK